MLIAAVSMFKDEEDVAQYVVEHMASQGVELIIVADNMSTDSTRERLEAANLNGAKLIVVEDNEPGYYQSEKMTNLANMAADCGAQWIVPFDADEIWSGHGKTIAEAVRGVSGGVGWMTATMRNYYPSIHDDLDEENPFKRILWYDPNPNPLPKWSFRWQEGAVIAQGNHSVHNLDGTGSSGLEIKHYPCRSFEHFKRKVINGSAAYAATNLSHHEGAHWRGYGAILAGGGDQALRDVFETWFWSSDPESEGRVRG